MNTDPIADLLTRLRNASKAKHPALTVLASSMKEELLKILLDEGYIASVTKVEKESKGKRPKASLKVFLRYDENGDPVIREIKRLSKPGRRAYVGKDEIPRYRGGLGMVVVSTPKGLLTDVSARKEGVGGELVCSVF